jgi:AraC-like DNA-binding protein
MPAEHFAVPAQPTASGAITREAVKLLREQGLDPGPFLSRAGISKEVVETSSARIPAPRQIKFLNLVAANVGDELLGMHLAMRFEPREAGLIYFVLASSETLREALRRIDRYTCIVNEGVRLTSVSTSGGIGVQCSYTGLSRYSDRHQIEFILTILIRIVSQITGLRVRPMRMSVSHPAFARKKEASAIAGCEIRYAAAVDEVIFEKSIADQKLIQSDPYLGNLLVGYCEEALASKTRAVDDLKTRVENAIVPLLPHGKARSSEVARVMGTSERSLSRQLASQDLSFSRILAALRLYLAQYYLKFSDLPVTEIAWLLGFKEPTAFTHAVKRWTGYSPAALRKHGAGPDPFKRANPRSRS